MYRKYFTGGLNDSTCKRQHLCEDFEDEYGDTFDDEFEDEMNDFEDEPDDSKYFEEDEDYGEFDEDPTDEELSKAIDDVDLDDLEDDDISNFSNDADLAELDDIDSFADILNDELRKKETDRSIYRIKYTNVTADTEYRVVPIARMSGRKYLFSFLNLGKKLIPVDISDIDLTDIWVED